MHFKSHVQFQHKYLHIFLSRHQSRLLLPTLQSCCCRATHSDTKPKDPFTLAQKDLTSLYDDIKKVSLQRDQSNLAFK